MRAMQLRLALGLLAAVLLVVAPAALGQPLNATPASTDYSAATAPVSGPQTTGELPAAGPAATAAAQQAPDPAPAAAANATPADTAAAASAPVPAASAAPTTITIGNITISAANLLAQPSCLPASGVTGLSDTSTATDGMLPAEGLAQCDVQGFIRRTSANMYYFRVEPELAADGSVAKEVDYSLLITLRSVDGNADLSLAIPGSTQPALRSQSAYTTYLQSEQFIAVPNEFLQQNPGRYIIYITGGERPTFFSLRVQTVRANVLLAPQEVTALQAIYNACCPSISADAAAAAGDTSTSLDTAAAAAQGGMWCSQLLPAALNPGRAPEDDMCHTAPSACNDQGQLTKLDLAGAQLRCPSFPVEFGAFSALETLDVAYNDFGGDTIGTMAQHLAPLQSLQRLFARYGNLTGTLTCELAQAHANLTILSVSGNEITGTVPECILQAPNLEELYISATNVTGTLPDLTTSSSLRVLFFINADPYSDHGLTGTFPASFAQAMALQYIDVSNNNLTGGLPDLPGGLLWLNVSNNMMDGSIAAIPPLLQTLDASDNDLTGSLPESFAASQSLAGVNLRNNKLTGSIPGFPSSLVGLSGRNNQFTGSLPPLPETLLALYLPENQLSGSLPPLTAPNIVNIVLGDNQLTGQLPPSWVSASQTLTTLDLSGNRLGGSLPAASAAGAVDTMAGRGRRLLQPQPEQQQQQQAASGITSEGLWQLPELVYMDLSNNSITGRIPGAVGALPNLLGLSLEHNQLTGNMQPYAAALAQSGAPLMYLNVSNNKLSGQIPDELSAAPMLDSTWQVFTPSGGGAPRVLDLSYNAWSGPYPLWLLEEAAAVARTCRCVLSVAISGPDSRITCPDAATLAKLNGTQLFVAQRSSLECWDPSQNKHVPVASLVSSASPATSATSPAAERLPNALETRAGSVDPSGNSQPQISGDGGGDSKLSSGAIAGIVVGSVVGAALLAALAIAGVVGVRRHRRQRDGWVKEELNQQHGLPPGPGPVNEGVVPTRQGSGAGVQGSGMSAQQLQQREQRAAAGIEMLRSGTASSIV